MSVLTLNSVVHLCEDTSQPYDLVALLAATGYKATLPLSISKMFVLDAAGVPDATVPPSFFTRVDNDTVKVDATAYPDRNFSVSTLTVVIDAGPNQINLKIQVIVDPVNDAPTAEDHTIDLGTATSYAIKVSDFGFADPHDKNPANQAHPAGDNFKSVVIAALPSSGSLLLNGKAVTAGQEIGVAEIGAGHLVYQPNPSVGGQTAFGFEVRDDGGLAGCNAHDLSTVHHMTFNCPTTACASIVGASILYEGNTATYHVHLDHAVVQDTQVWVSAIDASAHRTTTHATGQTITAGGYYTESDDGKTYYNQYYDPSTNIKHNVATGPANESWDYSLFDTSGKIVGAAGGFYVTIKAGQTDSASFSVEAYQEKVYVDRDVFPNGSTAYKEAPWETFSLNLSQSSNAAVHFCVPSTTICIGDTSTYYLYSPIALDLDGNGIQTAALIDSKGQFDLGSGKAVDSGWLSSGDAFLAVDCNTNGKIDNLSELFGGNKGDGFAKLASYDANHDGVVNAADADFAKLLVWQDLNGNHQTDAGELRTLAQAGIASLTVAYTDQSVNQLGNVLGETSSAIRSDGSAVTMTDVYFNVASGDSAAAATAATRTCRRCSTS